MTRAVLEALAAADLGRLGFRADDAADLTRAIEELSRQPQRLARVARLSHRLRSQIGEFFRDDLGVAEGDGPASLDGGLITLLALVAVSEDVSRAYVRRGVSEELAWRSLSDLGQQTHIFRSVVGCFGLFAESWCAANYTGRHLWLGRLQYTLEQDDEGYFLGVHVPECGPLTPEAVDDSLVLARNIAALAFPEYAPTRFMLHSWLIDPGIGRYLDPTSNFVRFAQRFELTEERHPGWRDALFFGFHIEPSLSPADLSALPADTSLRRAILRQLDGPGVEVRVGRLRGT